MTERLYYSDAYSTRFKAIVVEHLSVNGQPAVILDRTYFYPTGGGQPFDGGQIEETPVLEVMGRESDGAIIHVIETGIKGPEITAEIDWKRRFDHMQQHTGQHVLSQAFQNVAGAATVSFHIGGESCTIDLAGKDLTEDQLERAELLANQVIWQNRPVRAMMVSRAQAQDLPLRSVPKVEDDVLRLIEIEQFDLTACGGTHVANTGEIGMIKIVGSERRRSGLRLEFHCGERALTDFQLKNRIMIRLASELTTGYEELEPSVNRIRNEVRQLRRQLKQQSKRLLAAEAVSLREEGTHFGETIAVTELYNERDPAEVRLLANRLAQHPRTIALLGIYGAKAQLVLARSADAPGDMSQLIKHSLEALGSATGGGTATFAQGGGPAADKAQVLNALQLALEALQIDQSSR